MTNRTGHLVARLLVALIAVVVIATSCTGDDQAADDTTTESIDATTTTADPTDTTAATTSTSDDDDSSSSGDDAGADDSDLPGEAWDGFASAGDEFAVMGVAHDDELNVRALPEVSSEPESRVVQSVAPTVGDLGEITYDVIGLGDDSVAGMRLHIFATPDDNGGTFSLTSIERTVFCSRGTDGELCS